MSDMNVDEPVKQDEENAMRSSQQEVILELHFS